MELFSYKYAIPYLILLGYLVVLMLYEFRLKGRQKSILPVRVMLIAGFLFFFGLRGFVGTDFIGYYPFFNNLSTLGSWQGLGVGYFERGFTAYTILIKSIWSSYFFWVFVNTAIDVAILDILFRRYSKFYVLGFICFLCFGGLEMELNLYRNIKAILLFILSLKYLQERKILPYILLNGLGVLFHTTSLVYLPLYFILHRQFPKWLIWGIFILGNVFFFFHIEFFKPIFAWLIDLAGGVIQQRARMYVETDASYGITIGYIERIITYVIFALCYPYFARQRASNIIFANCYILYFASFFYLNELGVTSYRLSLLFIVSYWILYPNLIALVGKEVDVASLIDKFAPSRWIAFLKKIPYRQLCVAALMLYAVLKISFGSNRYFQRYDNLLFGIQSYEERKQQHDDFFEQTRSKYQ